MPQATTRKTAAAHLVDGLIAQGVDRVFCMPGESYLAVLDALADVTAQIETITCRHEGGAAFMAEADGKLLGRPGICMVTRGPGATNASAGLHVAMQDSTPMILLIGQIARGHRDREAFQEVDYRRMFGQVAKWVAEVDEAARLPEYLGRAFAVAMAGRPGPVVLALPEDLLTDCVDAPALRRIDPVEIHPSAQQMQDLKQLLDRAERPLLILGGTRWDKVAKQRIEDFAAKCALPVTCVFRRQDRFDNAHPNYVGELGLGANPALRKMLADADLLIVLGSRMGDIASDGFEDLSIPNPQQKLIHIHADASELNRLYHAELAINATPQGFAAALEGLDFTAGSALQTAARRSYENWQSAPDGVGAVNMAKVVLWLSRHLKADAILTNGAGNFASWLHRFHRYRTLGSQLAPTSGSMGYGVPAAIAASLRHPETEVICIAGDGDFMMTMNELATAAQFGAKPIFIVVDNGMLGTIRMHQESRYPHRKIATDLVNPDFCLIAHACGAHSEIVDNDEDFPDAFKRAQASGRMALIHVKVDPEALTVNRSLSQIRSQSQS